MSEHTVCAICRLPEAAHDGTEAHRFQPSHIPAEIPIPLKPSPTETLDVGSGTRTPMPEVRWRPADGQPLKPSIGAQLRQDDGRQYRNLAEATAAQSPLNKAIAAAVRRKLAAGDPEPFVVYEDELNEAAAVLGLPEPCPHGNLLVVGEDGPCGCRLLSGDPPPRVRPLAPAELLPTLYPCPGTVRS